MQGAAMIDRNLPHQPSGQARKAEMAAPMIMAVQAEAMPTVLPSEIIRNRNTPAGPCTQGSLSNRVDCVMVTSPAPMQ